MADMDLFGSDESDKEVITAKRSDHSSSESEEHDGNESDASHHSQNAERSGSDVQSERSGEHSDAPSEGEGGNRSKSESDGSGHASAAENQEDSDGNESQSGDDQASKNGEHSESDEAPGHSPVKSGSDDEGVPQRTRKSSDSSRSSSSSSSERDERPEPQHSGSENEEDLVESPKKKQRLITSEDEEGSPQPNATAQDIFGDDVGDISSADEGSDSKRKIPDEENFDDNNENRENAIEPTLENGDMEQEEPVPETRIEVEIPRISTNLGNEVHFVKLPNFLSVETRPYDPQWYEDEIDEDEVLDEEGRARLKLKVENTVRWRYAFDDDGNAIKESNAKIVRWSDGSLSLHLGSEIFDIHKQSLMQGDHNHLFIRQGTGLQGQAVFRTKLSFRPHSTDSFTHHKMTLSLANRSLKTQKIRVLPNVGKDPEAHRSEMIKKEEDKLKASIRRENKKRRMREKSHGRGLNASYLEDDDDEEGISLSAIKKSYKKGGAGLKERPSIYSSDDESGEEQRERRLEQAKNMDMDDDSDLDYFDKKSSEVKKKATKIEDSSDNSSSENGETGGGGDAAVEEEED